jgi:hypothetical protein
MYAELFRKARADGKTKQIIYYGVMATIRKEFDEYIYSAAKNAKSITDSMSELRPSEFINIFPIQKTYDGRRYECKDYFSAMEYINSLDPNAPIGNNIDDFLWEYHNVHTRMFNAKRFTMIDSIRRAEGQPSMIEEFFGVKPMRKYTDDRGVEYMLDSEGRTHKIRKQHKFKIIK